MAPTILEQAKQLALENQIEFDVQHALPRMRQRGASRHDVRDAVLSAKTYRPGDKPRRWVLDGGKDGDGDLLSVVVEIHDELLVVTIFGE